MDKSKNKEVQNLSKNLSEIVQTNNSGGSGCSHYKRKAKFVVSMISMSTACA
jgi:hypothetical protein